MTTMVEGMTSIELGTIPSQDPTTLGDIMPEEVMETPEERSVIDCINYVHVSVYLSHCINM